MTWSFTVFTYIVEVVQTDFGVTKWFGDKLRVAYKERLGTPKYCDHKWAYKFINRTL